MWGLVIAMKDHIIMRLCVYVSIYRDVIYLIVCRFPLIGIYSMWCDISLLCIMKCWWRICCVQLGIPQVCPTSLYCAFHIRSNEWFMSLFSPSFILKSPAIIICSWIYYSGSLHCCKFQLLAGIPAVLRKWTHIRWQFCFTSLASSLVQLKLSCANSVRYLLDAPQVLAPFFWYDKALSIASCLWRIFVWFKKRHYLCSLFRWW